MCTLVNFSIIKICQLNMLEGQLNAQFWSEGQELVTEAPYKQKMCRYDEVSPCLIFR